MVVSETEASDLAHDIHMHYVTHGFTWGSDEDIKTPSPEDIDSALGWMKKRLEKEPEGTTIFGGRMAIHKEADHYDVFVHFGETK